MAEIYKCFWHLQYLVKKSDWLTPKKLVCRAIQNLKKETQFRYKSDIYFLIIKLKGSKKMQM